MAPIQPASTCVGSQFAGASLPPLARGTLPAAAFCRSSLAQSALACGALLLASGPVRWGATYLVIVVPARLRPGPPFGGFSLLVFGVFCALASFTSEESLQSANSSISSSSVIGHTPHRQPPARADVHDADALELGHLEAEVLTHAGGSGSSALLA